MSLQIEAGKFYRRRDGEIVGPTRLDRRFAPHLWVVDIPTGGMLSWQQNGVWAFSGSGEFDLVEEVPDPNAKIEMKVANTWTTPKFTVDATSKPTNPKDAIGVRKWRNFTTVPQTVLAEVGAAMLEGAMKYGRHNYRVAGVRSSVYIDATMGHLMQWWEGEDLDPDTGLSHVTKALASLFVLRDAMIQDMLNDDRPPKAELDQVRDRLQSVVDAMFEKHREPKAPFTELAQTG